MTVCADVRRSTELGAFQSLGSSPHLTVRYALEPRLCSSCRCRATRMRGCVTASPSQSGNDPFADPSAPIFQRRSPRRLFIKPCSIRPETFAFRLVGSSRAGNSTAMHPVETSEFFSPKKNERKPFLPKRLIRRRLTARSNRLGFEFRLQQNVCIVVEFQRASSAASFLRAACCAHSMRLVVSERPTRTDRPRRHPVC